MRVSPENPIHHDYSEPSLKQRYPLLHVAHNDNDVLINNPSRLRGGSAPRPPLQLQDAGGARSLLGVPESEPIESRARRCQNIPRRVGRRAV